MKKLMIVAAIAFAAAFAFAQDAEIVKVLGKGTGADRVGALEDAYRDAIERAVGLYVDAEQMVKNEELVKDQILTQSNAYIEKYTILKEGARANGTVELQIAAEVRKTMLAKKLSDVMPKQTFVLGDETQNFHSKVVTTEKRNVDAAALLANVLNGVDPVKHMIKMTLADTKPKFWKVRSGQEKVLYHFRFTVDEAKYYGEFLPSLLKVLDQIALKPPKNVRLKIAEDRESGVSVGRRRGETKAQEYIDGNWDDRDVRVAEDGRPDFYLDGSVTDDGVYADDIALANASGKSWRISRGDGGWHPKAQMLFASAGSNQLVDGGMFRMLVITKMNAARTVIKAREYALPPECAEVVKKWHDCVVGDPYRNPPITSYNIVFSDGAGEEVSAIPVAFKNVALANTFVGCFTYFNECAAWYVTPMIHCDAASFERWIAFDIPRDQLPNVKSVSVELAE